MNSQLRTTIPTLIVMAMAVLCCWPYLVGDDALVIPEAMKVPKGLAAALDSESSNRNKRNPFDEAADEPEAAATVESPIKVDTKDIGAQQPQSVAEEQKTQLLTGLTLQATCISGRNRSALINGDLYEVGDDLGVANSLEVPMRVTWIDENAVVLRAEDRSLVLSYPNKSPEKMAQEEQAAQAAAAAEETSLGLDDPASLAELFFRSVRMSEQLRAERKTPSQTTSNGRRTR